MFHCFIEHVLRFIIYVCSFQNGLNEPCSSTSFHFMSKIAMFFLSLTPFFSKYTFLRLRHFVSTCNDTINPIFQWQSKYIRFKFQMKYFLLITTVGLVSEKKLFFFHSNYCQGNKFLYQNYAAYQSASWINGVIQIKNTQKKSCILCPISNDADLTISLKMHEKLSLYIPEWILFVF